MITRRTMLLSVAGAAVAPRLAHAATPALITRAIPKSGERLPIIGVGGILTADDGYERIRSGAALVQLYTALIYEGPGVAGRLLRGLAERLERDGFSTIAEAIGADVR